VMIVSLRRRLLLRAAEKSAANLRFIRNRPSSSNRRACSLSLFEGARLEDIHFLRAHSNSLSHVTPSERCCLSWPGQAGWLAVRRLRAVCVRVWEKS